MRAVCFLESVVASLLDSRLAGTEFVGEALLLVKEAEAADVNSNLPIFYVKVDKDIFHTSKHSSETIQKPYKPSKQVLAVI